MGHERTQLRDRNMSTDVTAATAADLSQLRVPFPPEVIGTLPRAGVKLSFVGHAAVTDRLLSVDPYWSWEPLAVDDHGFPLLTDSGELWINLTVLGVTRMGVSDPGQTLKIAIGDAIRNAAMRFGVALDLWSKDELESQVTPRTPVVVPKTPNLDALREAAAGFTDDWQKLVMSDARERCGWPTKLDDYDEDQAGNAAVLAQRILDADEPFGLDGVDSHQIGEAQQKQADQAGVGGERISPPASAVLAEPEDAPASDGSAAESGEGTDEVCVASSVPDPEPVVEVDPVEAERAAFKKAHASVRIIDITKWVQEHGAAIGVETRAQGPKRNESKASRLTRIAAQLEVTVPELAELILEDLAAPVPENAGGRDVAASHGPPGEGEAVGSGTEAGLPRPAQPMDTASPELEPDGELFNGVHVE